MYCNFHSVEFEKKKKLIRSGSYQIKIQMITTFSRKFWTIYEDQDLVFNLKKKSGAGGGGGYTSK